MDKFDRSNHSKFYNSTKNNNHYMKLKSHIENSPNFTRFSDINMYLSHLYYNTAITLKSNCFNFRDCSADDSSFKKLLSNNLGTVYSNLLSNTVILTILLEHHNQQFGVIGNRINKPLRRTPEDIAELFLLTQNDSILELLAKNIDWSSKTAKEVELVKRNILEQIPGDIDINGNTIEYIYQHISSSVRDGKMVMAHFLEFLNDNFDEPENIKQKDSIYKFIFDLLKESNEKIGSNISINDLYKYCCCKFLQEYLYRIKTLSQVEIYKQESKNRNESINSGVYIEIERDKNMSESSTDFNDQFKVSIPFYINCFRDHTNGHDFNPIINEQIMSDMDSQKLPIDSLESIPFRPFLTVKLRQEDVFQLLSILKEYDNPKINCLRNSENQNYLDKVYAYLADMLHHSINFANTPENEMDYPSKYLLTDISKFKSIFQKDEEIFKRQIGSKDSSYPNKEV